MPPILRGVLLLVTLTALIGCKRTGAPQAPQPRPMVKASETPVADKLIAEGEEDPSWLAGTWKKDGEPRWMLFNLPAEVAELAGKPARVVRRGKLVIHGRYISAIFPDGEVQIEGSRDHGVLTAAGNGVYRRGSPP